MAGLIARDAVMKPGAVASADMVGGSVQRLPKGSVCVVFQHVERQTQSGLLGILSADLLSENQERELSSFIGQVPPMIFETQPVAEVLKLLRSDGPDVLPVFDTAGMFLGIISQRTILEALLRRERQLLRKTREFRQTAYDDKERRYETTRRLEQTNLAFRKLLLALSRPDSLESFKQALEALTVVADAGWAQLALCDESGRVTQRILASHPSEDSHPPNYLAENLMIEVLSENRLVSRFGTFVSADEAGGDGGQQKKKQAFIGLPLSMDERRFGCVYLWDKLTGREFVDDDEVLLASLGHAVALTVAHAIDHARRKRLEAELDLLARLAREAGGAATLECVAEIVRDRTHEHWNWDAFAATISRSNGTRLQGILEVDKAVAPVDGGEKWPQPYSYFAEEESDGLHKTTRPQVNRRILSGEPVLINRQELDNVELLKPFGDLNRPSASLMYVPIISRARVVGVLTVQSYKKNRFNSADLALLQRIGDAVGPAFVRCMAECKAKAFFTLASKLSAASTPREAAKIIVDVADDLIGWDSCSIYFYDARCDLHTNILMMDIVDGERTEVDSREGVTRRPGGLSRQVVANGKPILYLRPEPRFDKTQSEPFGDRNRPSASLLHVPLRFKDRILGVLSLQSYSINAYDNHDLELLTALADQCSGAIERIQKG